MQVRRMSLNMVNVCSVANYTQLIHVYFVMLGALNVVRLDTCSQYVILFISLRVMLTSVVPILLS